MSVSPKFIDRHCKECVECEQRRVLMKELHQIPLAFIKADESIARDLLLEQAYEECCKCFIKGT